MNDIDLWVSFTATNWKKVQSLVGWFQPGLSLVRVAESRLKAGFEIKIKKLKKTQI